MSFEEVSDSLEAFVVAYKWQLGVAGPSSADDRIILEEVMVLGGRKRGIS